MRKCKKILIVLLLFTGILYICRETYDKDTYYCSTDANIYGEGRLCNSIKQTFCVSHKRLNSIELALFEISENTTEQIVLNIVDGELLLYETKLSVNRMNSNEWYRVKLNIPLMVDKEYVLELTSEENKYIPIYVSDKEIAPESVECNIDGDIQNNQILVRYGYLKNEDIVTKLFKMLIILFVCFIIWNATTILSKFKEVCCKISSCDNGVLYGIILEVLFAFIIFECSGIDFQAQVKCVLIVISLAATYNLKEKLKFVYSVLKTSKAKVGFGLINLYAAFALVGNRLFVYPLDIKIRIINFMVYCVAVCWFVPVISSFIFWYDNIKLTTGGYETHKKIYIIVVLTLTIPAMVSLYAFNPCISTVDSVSCLAQYAHAVRNMPDWHPPFYILILKIIISIWDSTYLVVFAQWLFWIYVVLEMFILMRKCGVSEKLLVIISFFLGCNTATWLHLCTIWKDIPYSISLLWLTIIIFRLLYYKDENNKRYIYFELVISLLFTCLLRQNGIVPYIAVIVSLLIVMRHQYKIIISIIMSVILVLIVKYPIYSYLNIDEQHNGGIYIGLSQDVLGVYYSGGDLSEDSIKMVNVLTYHNSAEHVYSPYFASSSYDLSISKVEFIKNYLDTFINNPLIMMRAIICRQDCIWDIFDGQDCILGCVGVYHAMDDDDMWRSYYPPRIQNGVTNKLIEISNNSASNQLIRLLTWRSGIYTLMMVFVFFICYLRKNKKYLIVFIPFIGQATSLLLSTGWSDFRYYWPLNLCSLFILIIVPAIKENHYKG